MKKFYQLCITVRDEGTRNEMTVGYTNLDAARAQLDAIANYYGGTWNVPPQGDDHWHVFVAAAELKYITFNHDTTDRMFQGSLSEYPMIEEGEEVGFLPGTVLKSTENPNVLMQLRSVYLKGQDSLDAGFPIDMETEQPTPAPTGGVDMASLDEAKKYFAAFDKINNTPKA